VAGRATPGRTGRAGATERVGARSREAVIEVARASAEELPVASAILTEAARWLIARGQPLWEPSDLVPERLRAGVADGSLHLALRDGQPVGTIALLWDDPLFWPDVAPGESAFVHRLAVRRSVAGTGVAEAMLAWAVERASGAGRRWLRLDCSARHDRLCAYYRSAGFRACGTRDIGSYRGQLFERSLDDSEAAGEVGEGAPQ
jgi:GNAT superfamily N-acetyltransferase